MNEHESVCCKGLKELLGPVCPCEMPSLLLVSPCTGRNRSHGLTSTKVMSEQGRSRGGEKEEQGYRGGRAKGSPHALKRVPSGLAVDAVSSTEPLVERSLGWSKKWCVCVAEEDMGTSSSRPNERFGCDTLSYIFTGEHGP